MSRVRELAQHIMKDSKYVIIFPERAAELSDLLRDVKIELPTWDFPPFYPQGADFETACLHYLLLNSINYCYFDEYGNVFKDGDFKSSSLAALRITENLEELRDPMFLSHVDENYMLGELFKAEVPISLVKESVFAFREIGEFLNRNVEFTFKKLFTKTHNNAYLTSQYLPNILPSWNDPFYKRAQLFVGMVHGRFGCFSRGLEDLTVFADYKVPQTLHAMGMLRYKFDIFNTISSNNLIPKGSLPELEIRAATIILTDKLTEALNAQRSDPVNALHTDYLLWSAMRNTESLPQGVLVHNSPTPHHRTMTTDY